VTGGAATSVLNSDDRALGIVIAPMLTTPRAASALDSRETLLGLERQVLSQAVVHVRIASHGLDPLEHVANGISPVILSYTIDYASVIWMAEYGHPVGFGGHSVHLLMYRWSYCLAGRLGATGHFYNAIA
jgi:hypothetical protein